MKANECYDPLCEVHHPPLNERRRALIRLVLDYDFADQDERENIERTLLEILRNEPVQLP